MFEESTDAGQDFDFSPPSASGELEALLNDSEQQTDTAEDSSPETNETEEAPSQEGEAKEEKTPEANTPDESKELPLNKDARWQEKLKENQSLREQLAQQKEMLDKFMSMAQPQATEEIPQVFKQAFGTGDPEQDKVAWNTYKQLMDFQKEQILSEIQQKEEAKNQEVSKWESWVTEQVDMFQSQGVDIPKDEFVEIIKEFEPSDGLKSYDPVKVVKIYEMKKEIEKLKVGEKQEEIKNKKKAQNDLASLGSNTSRPQEQKDTFTLDDSPMWKRILKS